MARIQTVDPEAAQGNIAQVFGRFRQGSGVIPGPVELLSASPGLFDAYTGTFAYWIGHPTLSHDLLNCIRHGVAVRAELPSCVVFNEAVLKAAGMDDDELAALRRDPDTAPLEDRERALLNFVLSAVADPDATTDEDVAALRTLGWSDAELLDATYHGAVLVTMGILMRTFGG